jgi:hypothetical protein
MRRRSAFALIAAALAVQAGCLSTARLSDLPATSADVQFGMPFKDAYGWYEYDFTTESSEEELRGVTRQALTDDGFTIVRDDPQGRVMTADRGLRAHEWASVVGVYWEPGDTGLAVKIIYEITQDFTGTWTGAYAERIGHKIENLL